MAEYLIKDSTLTEIADAIRTKTGSTDTITANNMANKILTIVSGGSTIEDISTESEMNSALAFENIGKIYRYTGETGETYVSGDIYVVESDDS